MALKPSAGTEQTDVTVAYSPVYSDFSECCCCCAIPEARQFPFDSGGRGRTDGLSLDQYVREMAWLVPPPPAYYHPAHAITADQLALMLRNSQPVPSL